MNLLDSLLLIVAAVFFLLAALNFRNATNNLIAVGLFAWVLVPLIAALRHLA